jgi:hypothetical protein
VVRVGRCRIRRGWWVKVTGRLLAHDRNAQEGSRLECGMGGVLRRMSYYIYNNNCGKCGCVCVEAMNPRLVVTVYSHINNAQDCAHAKSGNSPPWQCTTCTISVEFEFDMQSLEHPWALDCTGLVPCCGNATPCYPESQLLRKE